MNTLRTAQTKYKLTGDDVNQFKSYKGKELTPQQRIEQLEKKFNTVVYFALALLVALFVTLFK